MPPACPGQIDPTTAPQLANALVEIDEARRTGHSRGFHQQ
jgi:hypothetical protein